MDIDLDGSRLFVAALSAGSVEVIDLRAGKRAARIQPLHEPQGVAYLAGVHRLFVANGAGGNVQAFNEAKAPAVTGAEGLEDADNVRVDPAPGQLYVGYAHALAVLDPVTLRLIKRIELGGHPEAFELESAGARVFVNVPSAGQIRSWIGSAARSRQRGISAVLHETSRWPWTNPSIGCSLPPGSRR
jgi:DNA-binding beta-propeller fold protein YncE